MTALEPATSESAALVIAASPAEIADLPREQRGELITHALIESKQWLAVATRGTDPTPIAEFKAWAATVAEMTKQKGLAQEIQADALEMVRRAERGIGVAIRNGQESGAIRVDGERITSGNQYSAPSSISDTSKPGPRDFLTSSEWTGNGAGVVDLVDGVTDATFEAALGDARSEGNLSRANVVRKVRGVKADGLTPAEKLARIRELAPRGFTSQQIAADLGTTEGYVRDKARENSITVPADEVLRGTHRLRVDSNHLVNHAVMTLEGLASGLSRVNYDDLDKSQMQNWADSLSASFPALRGFVNKIKEKAQ